MDDTAKAFYMTLTEVGLSLSRLSLFMLHVVLSHCF